MAAIRGTDTRPEMIVRRGLHARGFRFRLHDPKLPGRPDLVLPKHHAVLFVNGCFWHGHDCYLFKWPKTRERFWREKITANAARDTVNLTALHEAGWRVAIVWECALRGRLRRTESAVLDAVSDWLRAGGCDLAVRGLPESPSAGEPI